MHSVMHTQTDPVNFLDVFVQLKKRKFYTFVFTRMARHPPTLLNCRPLIIINPLEISNFSFIESKPMYGAFQYSGYTNFFSI